MFRRQCYCAVATASSLQKVLRPNVSSQYAHGQCVVSLIFYESWELNFLCQEIKSKKINLHSEADGYFYDCTFVNLRSHNINNIATDAGYVRTLKITVMLMMQFMNSMDVSCVEKGNVAFHMSSVAVLINSLV